MTTHDKEKIIAAAKEADSGFTGDDDFNLGTYIVGLEAIERFYAIAFESGRQAEREAGEPSAWELRVRRADTEWRRYSIYESHKQALDTMKRVEGPPLELKIVPLYAAEEEP